MRRKAVSRDDAEAIALSGLAMLADDPARMERFLALSGVAPGDIRAVASTAAFQLAVLGHIRSDESLLLSFAANNGIDPEAVGEAERVLGAPPR